jgi:hypothetical protein
MTETQKRIADVIIDHFIQRDGVTTTKDNLYKFQSQEAGFTLNNIRYVIAILVLKGLIARNDGSLHGVDTFYLTDKGWDYEGYDYLIDEETRIKELEEEQLQSVIDTNKSVKNTNRLQKWILIFTAAASAATLIISFLDYDKDTITNVAAPQVRVQLPLPMSGKDTLLQNQPDSQAVQ